MIRGIGDPPRGIQGTSLSLWGQSVLGLRLEIQAQVELLLPSIGFFANVRGDRGAYVTPARKPSIRVISIVEPALGVQVVLCQHVSVALKLVARYGFAGLAGEATLCRLTEITVVGPHIHLNYIRYPRTYRS
jgi:hypothetical protein